MGRKKYCMRCEKMRPLDSFELGVGGRAQQDCNLHEKEENKVGMLRPCEKCREDRPIEEFATYPYGGGTRTRQYCKRHDGVSTELPAIIPSAPLAPTPPPAHPTMRNGNQYADLFKKQNGCCAICNQPETTLDEIGQALPLSFYGAAHYGARRMALLCKLCNMGLSMFRDSPALLARAIAFLTQKGPTAEADVRILSNS